MSEVVGGGGGGGSALLIAPTEPPSLKRIGTSSSIPESFGVDVLWGVEHLGLCGVQRKELKDLVASMQDGRLSKEIAQMHGKLAVQVLLVEGRGKWGENGVLMDAWAQRVTRPQIRNYLYTIRMQGVWVETSDNLEDTIAVIRDLVRWTQKKDHTALLGRPGPSKGDWGQVSKREWAIHLLCGFEGIGPGVAANIIDHFGGVPLGWDVSEKELQEVPGIGRVRARRMMEALIHDAGAAVATDRAV